MSTFLRSLYDSMNCFSTETQIGMCGDLTSGLRSVSKANLADWFVEAFRESLEFTNVEQPFLNAASTARRKSIGLDARGDNRIAHLLGTKKSIRAVGQENGYEFVYVERQVPPSRVERGNQPTSGAGGIDYIARRNTSPILGEIKVKDDQNAFYAFIQLLTYLSEMATPNQVMRANRHGTFGVQLVAPPAFDLHILLADFNGRGEKGKLTDLTKGIAEAFKRRLSHRYPTEAGLIGSILCLNMNSEEFASPTVDTLECIWCV